MQKYRYSCNTPEEKAVPLHDFLVYFALRGGGTFAQSGLFSYLCRAADDPQSVVGKGP